MDKPAAPSSEQEQDKKKAPKPAEKLPREIGGPPGPDPTRYGDWTINGRCVDF